MLTRKHNITILATIFTLALFVLGMGAQQAAAVTFTFNGVGDGTTWTLDTNWDSSPPGPANNIGGGDTFNVGGAFTTAGTSLEVGNSAANGSTAGIGTGTLNVSTTGVVPWSGGIFLMSRDQDSQVTQTAGTVASTIGMLLGNGDGITPGLNARYDLDGGIVNTSGFTFLADRDHTMVFDQTTGTAGYGDGAGGDYFVMAPDPGQLGDATYQISGGSFTHLAGTGVFAIGGGAALADGGTALFHIDGSGASSVSTNASTVEVFDGGTMQFTMDGSGVTPFTASGATVDVSAGSLAFDFSALSGTIGDIPLIDKTSGGAITGPFSNAADGTLYPVGSGSYLLSYSAGDGNDLWLLEQAAATVPEPSTFALAALGMLALGLAGWRPRRMKG
jgi:hypothetical protein